MIKGTTASGFAYEVEKAAMENMELLELLAENGEENLLIYPKLTEMIFGKEQKQALYAHLRNEKGRVPINEVVNAVKDVFTAYGTAGKN